MFKRPTTRTLLLSAALILSLAVLTGCTALAPDSATVPEATATPVETALPVATAEVTTQPSQATDNETQSQENADMAQATATAEQVTLPVFTAETLAQYTGQDDNPAYVAVDGKVYDVTNVPQWRSGSHFGRFQAGVDLTEEIKTLSPHGVAKLNGVPIVGLYE